MPILGWIALALVGVFCGLVMYERGRRTRPYRPYRRTYSGFPPPDDIGLSDGH